MSIGKTDEQSIYNINIQQCRTRSYLCINDFRNYERENDVAQMYANDNAYSLADVKEKMGELFRSLYPCEDEIELQKAEFNICYLSKDEKEVENGNLVGIGEYSLTGNQVIAGIPILATAASTGVAVIFCMGMDRKKEQDIVGPKRGNSQAMHKYNEQTSKK